MKYISQFLFFSKSFIQNPFLYFSFPISSLLIPQKKLTDSNSCYKSCLLLENNTIVSFAIPSNFFEVEHTHTTLLHLYKKENTSYTLTSRSVAQEVHNSFQCTYIHIYMRIEYYFFKRCQKFISVVESFFSTVAKKIRQHFFL